MQPPSNMTTMCGNITDIGSNERLNCSKHILNFSPTEMGATKATIASMEQELAIAAMVFNLRYYIEGVILTPVATIGLFGKLNK